MRFGLPSHYIIGHDIEISQATHFLSKPACFALELLHLRALQHRRENRKGAAQPAKTYAQLVWPFRVVHFLDDDYVECDLIKALPKDGPSSKLGGLSRIKCNFLGFLGSERRVNPALLGQHVAASSLGKARKPQATIGKQCFGNV